MLEEKKKEGSFDPGCVADIQDKLLSNNYALKALASLLNSSDLSDFADQYPADVYRENNYEAEALRFGISQIIDLYLAHQEQIIKEYVDQYFKSDMHLVGHTKVIINDFRLSNYTSKDVAIRELREEIANLDTVINRDGELKGKAEELKETCMRYLEQLTAKAKKGG